MSEEKRMLGNYEVVNSIYIGDKEVVFGVDKSDKYPFLVSYCDYHNPFGVPWATESVGCDDYLEAMGIFIQRVQSQIEKTKSELSKFAFDNTVFTKDHCIPDKRSSSIVGKVVLTVGGAGNIIIAAKSPLGMLCILAVLIAFIYIPELIKKKRRS